MMLREHQLCRMEWGLLSREELQGGVEVVAASCPEASGLLHTPFICLVGGWQVVKREPDSRAAVGDDVDPAPALTPSAFLSG